MLSLLKAVAIAGPFATGFFMLTLRAGAQEESSVLVEAPTKSSVDVLPLPPPQQPFKRPAQRQLEARPVRQPFMRPAESMPAPISPEATVHPAPRMVTHASRSARRMFGRSGQVELVMVAENPADSCLYEIPLCVPACCTGQPTVVERRGIFGRGVVEYCWPCGFTATVKFRHILKDVKVGYDT